MRFACLIVLSSLLTFTLAQWTVVNFKPVVGTSFVNSSSGWVAGVTRGQKSPFSFTSDGAYTFTKMKYSAPSNTSLNAFLSICLASETWGVAGGGGFISGDGVNSLSNYMPYGAYSNDGATWKSLFQEGISSFFFRGCSAVNDGRTGVLIGEWKQRSDFRGNGIRITTDGGNTWQQYTDNSGNKKRCRFGDFISKDLGYVTAGNPGLDSTFELDENGEVVRFHLSRHLSFDFKENRYEINTEPRYNSSISGIISKVTDEGRHWEVMVNITGECFNQISCVDANNCWAVTESDQFGSILHTTDGWVTYENQLKGSTFTAIEMQTASFGWAIEYLNSDARFWKTTDGNTWTLDSTIKYLYPIGVSVPSENHAYATGISHIFIPVIAGYSPRGVIFG